MTLPKDLAKIRDELILLYPHTLFNKSVIGKYAGTTILCIDQSAEHTSTSRLYSSILSLFNSAKIIGITTTRSGEISTRNSFFDTTAYHCDCIVKTLNKVLCFLR